ncbi:MAG TPA: hypothetical protein VHX16_07190, partial [Chloroflexota bacterium]|nr:hypothetical protein [Chloroflexota bacterium]
EEHLALIARGEDARSEAEAARTRLELVLASQTAREAAMLRERFSRAAELQPLFPDGAPPTVLDDGELANSVAAALTRWQSQPEEPRLSGMSVAQIRLQLDALPQMPAGDLQPHPSVLTARDQLTKAATAMEQHAALEPPLGPEPDSGGLTEDELRQLSFDLRSVAVGTDGHSQSAQTRASSNVQTRPIWLIGGGVVAAVGLVLLLTSSSLLGVPLLIVGLAAAAWGLVLRRKDEPADVEATRAEVSERVRAAAEGRAAAAGLSADPASLLALADRMAATRTRREAWDLWAQRQSELRIALAHGEDELREALRSRGCEPGSDLAADVQAYEAACRERQAIAAEAAKRPGIEAQFEARQAAEKAAEEAALLRQQARQDVLEASARCGIAECQPDQMVEALRSWTQQRAQRLADLDSQHRQWTELMRLLDGRTLDQLDHEASAAEAAAEQLAQKLPAGALGACALESDVNAQVLRLRETHERLASVADQLQGQIKNESGRLPSVSLAEEALAAAQAELDRLSRLRDTITKTKQYLEIAQDRINHAIAPVLNDSVGRRLGQITGGRYNEVRVDPEDLNVRVRLPNGSLQPAHLLSHGTAEQVYLLLRVAMAERLTKPDEVCPLILDDVTVQSDGERTRTILETLHAVSAERQIILFTQEEDVLSWAETTLAGGGRDQLIRLNVPAASA